MVEKYQSTWTNFAIYTGSFFMAIPAALVAEALAAFRTESPVVIALVGRFSLFAFFAGLVTLTLAFWIVRRRIIAATLHSALRTGRHAGLTNSACRGGVRWGRTRRILP